MYNFYLGFYTLIKCSAFVCSVLTLGREESDHEVQRLAANGAYLCILIFFALSHQLIHFCKRFPSPLSVALCHNTFLCFVERDVTQSAEFLSAAIFPIRLGFLNFDQLIVAGRLVETISSNYGVSQKSPPWTILLNGLIRNVTDISRRCRKASEFWRNLQ